MEANGEAETTSDPIHVEFMPGSMIGPSAWTMSTAPTITQTDKLVVGVEAANNIGVEAEVLDAYNILFNGGLSHYKNSKIQHNLKINPPKYNTLFYALAQK